MAFNPDSITQDKLHELRRAAEHAWSDETRPEDSRGHPQPSAGHCFVTSRWLQSKLGGGHVGQKEGHFFWVSPDKNYVVDLTGDQDAYGPTKWAPTLQDEDDEAYEFEPEQMRHRPGPIIYTRATNPLYRDFRISDPTDVEGVSGNLDAAKRSQLFAERANAALEGNLPTKQADAGGAGSDAYPGETPQAEEDFNHRYMHDPVIDDLNLSMEPPVEREYRFVYVNGQLQVSPIEGHEDMMHHAEVGPDHQGPMAVGYVNVRGRDALWSAETNVGLRGLVKLMKDYTKRQKWTWGGLTDSTGNSIHDDFAAKKSFWYGFREGDLKLSPRPFWGSYDEIEVIGKTAHFNRPPNPFVLDGLEEWAGDFGYRIAEYPGGTDMNDRVKNKEWPTTYDKGDPEADPGRAFEGDPQGPFTCPYCHEEIPNFRAYTMHTKEHQDPKLETIDDGHFPTIRPLDEPLGFGTQSQPTAIPVIGAIQQDSWYFPLQMEGAWDEGARWHFEADAVDPRVKCPHCGSSETVRKDQVSNGVPFAYGFCRSCGMNFRWPAEGEVAPVSAEHPDPWMDNEPGTMTIPEHWSFKGSFEFENKPLWDFLAADLPWKEWRMEGVPLPVIGAWRFEAGETRTQALKRAQTVEQRIGKPDTSRVIHTFPDNWTIRELQSYADAQREGELMGNCFAPGALEPESWHTVWHNHPDFRYHGRAGLIGPEEAYNDPNAEPWGFPPQAWDQSREVPKNLDLPLNGLYSLRDPDNLPHASIDDNEALGKHNDPLKGEYLRRVDEWQEPGAETRAFTTSWRFEAAGGKEGKDLLQAPIPFIYDIEKDYITVGHPGMQTHEVMGQFTPGGIVEGYYEPKGKMVITTTTTIPFSTFHMMQLWYFSHPGLEITSLELESQTGDKHKVASTDVGTYVKSLAAARTAGEWVSNAEGPLD